MHTTWIIAANAGRARFFAESDPQQPLQEVEDMVNPAERLRGIDTQTDETGRTAATNSSHNIGGTQDAVHGHAAGAPNKEFQPAETPEQHAAALFARDIAHYLLEAHNDGRFQQLVLSAAPHFLGALRQHLDPQIRHLVQLEVDKDYTQFDARQLQQQLLAQLRSH